MYVHIPAAGPGLLYAPSTQTQNWMGQLDFDCWTRRMPRLLHAAVAWISNDERVCSTTAWRVFDICSLQFTVHRASLTILGTRATGTPDGWRDRIGRGGLELDPAALPPAKQTSPPRRSISRGNDDDETPPLLLFSAHCCVAEFLQTTRSSECVCSANRIEHSSSSGVQRRDVVGGRKKREKERNSEQKQRARER